jgi:hypothetical protein
MLLLPELIVLLSGTTTTMQFPFRMLTETASKLLAVPVLVVFSVTTQGFISKCFSGYIPNTDDILLAELTAIRQGLQLAIDKVWLIWYVIQTFSYPSISSWETPNNST